MQQKKRKTLYECFFKRLIDVCVSLTALLLLWPIFLVLAILVRAKLGSPVFFAQERPGRAERIFRMYKFRTMTDAKDAEGNLLSDEERLTPFGARLRSLSLDELPELFNILKGDMSIVGPRPLLVQYLPLYNETQRRRHEVRPGLTGLAQVNGRNATTWEKRFEWDVRYVERITFLGDLKILFSTVRAVLRKEGISAEGCATMLPFTGETVPTAIETEA